MLMRSNAGGVALAVAIAMAGLGGLVCLADEPAAANPSSPSRAAEYPHVEPDQRAATIEKALSGATDDKERFTAVWGLAISGYTKETAEALAAIAADSQARPIIREYAAMGLRNFISAMPDEVRKKTHERLHSALDAEKEKLPDAVMRLLVEWGDADRIGKLLGDKLRNHRMEIEVLKSLSKRDAAVERLWELYKAAAPVGEQAGWYRRFSVAEALVSLKDKRGIDIYIECLSVKEPWPAAGTSDAAKDSNLRSFRQCLHNTYQRVAVILDDDFGYEGGGTWTEGLEKAIPELADWWAKNGKGWSFEEATSTVVPKVQAGKALTKRQARVLAAKLANDAFAKANFKNALGKPVGKIALVGESFNRVTRDKGRWVLEMVGSRGPEAKVSFASDGTDAKVSVNYAMR